MNQFASGVGVSLAAFATTVLAYDHCVSAEPSISGWLGVAAFLLPVLIAFAAGRLTAIQN